MGSKAGGVDQLGQEQFAGKSFFTETSYAQQMSSCGFGRALGRSVLYCMLATCQWGNLIGTQACLD